MLVYSAEKFYLVVINEAVNLGRWITLTSTTIKRLQWKYFVGVNLTTINDYFTFRKKAGLTASHMAILGRENITYSAEICGQQAWISLMIKIAVNIWYWSSGWATSDDLPGTVLHIHAGGHLQTAGCTHLRFAICNFAANCKQYPLTGGIKRTKHFRIWLFLEPLGDYWY